jgi:hypothetical protein
MNIRRKHTYRRVTMARCMMKSYRVCVISKIKAFVKQVRRLITIKDTRKKDEVFNY